MATLILAELDAETRFMIRAELGKGKVERGLELLEKARLGKWLFEDHFDRTIDWKIDNSSRLSSKYFNDVVSKRLYFIAKTFWCGYTKPDTQLHYVKKIVSPHE